MIAHRIARTAPRAAGLAAFAAVLAVAGHADSATLSLSVSPLVIEMHAAPGESAAQQVTLRNSGSDTERVVVQPMDWRTTADGTVRIERVGAEGKSSLSDRLRMAPGDVVLKPGETRSITLTLDLPQSFSRATATYWGGFTLRAVDVAGKGVPFGAAANVVVYETMGRPRSHVTLEQLHVTPVGKDSANVTLRIVNDGVAYVRPAIHTQISEAGRVVHDETVGTPVVFGGAARVYNAPLTGLRPGTYQVDTTVDYGGPTLVEGSTTFTMR